MVVVFATNEEREFRDYGRGVAAERWPHLRCRVENPSPYTTSQRSDADAVVVHPRWQRIIDDYRAAGADVYVTDGTSTEPAESPAAPILSNTNVLPSVDVAAQPVRLRRRRG